jgi:hypothetical protein
MFKKENINPAVQKALYRKIDAMNRLALTEDRITKNAKVYNQTTGKIEGGFEENNNKAFFIGNSLEPQDSSNPIEQHLYRGTFAKVSVAVPEFNSDESDVIRKPISISSYIENKSNAEGILESVTQKDTPLTFREGIGETGENGDNLFLGHSGITSIKVEQQEYYTYKYTIGWVCPDPVYFEEVFEPSFLKFGAYVAMEFGWGMNDSSFDVPALSIEEMKRLLNEEGRLLKRNQDSAGNYHCGVGTVIMFKWSIQESGIYAGDIQVMTPGANTLLENPGGTSDSSDAIPVRRLNNTLEIKRLAKEILVDLADKNEADRTQFLKDAGVSEQQLINALQDSNETSNTLEENSIVFGLVMKNLSSVCDKYLTGPSYNIDTNTYSDGGLKENKNFFDNSNAYDDLYNARLKYKYRNGLMRIDVRASEQKPNLKGVLNYVAANFTSVKTGGLLGVGTAANQDSMLDSALSVTAANNVPDHMKERHFATWGWFEDNILKSFFELTTADGTKLQEIKSETSEIVFDINAPGFLKLEKTPNPCVSTRYLYSLGLDHTILPKKHNPILEKGFDIVKPEQKSLIPQFYKREQRIELDRIRLVYAAIDKEFPIFETATSIGKADFVGPLPTKTDNESTKNIDESLEVETPGKGSIRNMVFPIEKFITHFESAPSLRQGLRNFWADVSNQYGGFWSFQIGQDVNKPTRVGVFDTYYSEKKNSVTDKASAPDDPKGRFEFSVLSDKSIVKSFDVDLQLTGEAATLARYGGFSKANRGTSRIDGKKDLGLEAWNILNSAKSSEDILTKEQLERFKEIQPDIVKGLEYSSKTIDFKSIPNIKEDSKKILEKVENERSQFLSGVGCYDKRGNFSQYFKQTMLYLINYSDLKGTESNLTKLQVPLPVEVSLTLDGIGGFKVGELFSVDYLPQLYRKHCYFMISNIGHSVTTAGWDTTITGKMMADMPDFYNRSGKKLGAGLKDYLELFTLTTIGETDLVNLNAFQTEQTRLLKVESKNAYDKVTDKITKLYNKFQTAGYARKIILYTRILKKQVELSVKWNKYLEVLEVVGNDIFTKTETQNYNTFLNEKDSKTGFPGLNIFLERNETYYVNFNEVGTGVSKKFSEDRPTVKAIFDGIKNAFKRTQE